jgi:cytochrome c-type biogenesis protein CcmH/NrfF
MKSFAWLTIILEIALMGASWAPRGLAQGQAVERKDIVVDQQVFKDVASDLRCPTCTGLSVLDSDAAFSVQIKNEVRSQLAAGKSKDDILKFFTERYGPWILREPPKEGVHLLAWVVPLAVLIFGPILIFIFVWKRTPRTSGDGSGDMAESSSVSLSVSLSVEAAVTEMQERLKALRGGAHG